jgi:tetratricopeptide (TPR) repeat protein
MTHRDPFDDEGPVGGWTIEEVDAICGDDPPPDVASFTSMIECTTEMQVKPLMAIGYVGRGQAYLERGEPLRAIRDFTTAIGLEPDGLNAYLKRADAYFRIADLKAAIADATHVIRSQWDYSPLAYIIRGRAHFELGEIEQSGDDFNAALELDPDAPTRISRGFTRALLGDEEGALADYSAAIRLDPGNSWAFERRGKLYLKRGDCERALADFTQAIRLEPGNAKAYCGRGCVRLVQRQFEEAVADLTEAISLDPRTFRAHLHRGHAYCMRDRVHSALADLTEAIRLEPECAELYQLRGIVYVKLNDKVKAAADFRTFGRLRE